MIQKMGFRKSKIANLQNFTGPITRDLSNTEVRGGGMDSITHRMKGYMAEDFRYEPAQAEVIMPWNESTPPL